jgi:hypothetical protein
VIQLAIASSLVVLSPVCVTRSHSHDRPSIDLHARSIIGHELSGSKKKTQARGIIYMTALVYRVLVDLVVVLLSKDMREWPRKIMQISGLS